MQIHPVGSRSQTNPDSNFIDWQIPIQELRENKHGFTNSTFFSSFIFVMQSLPMIMI